MVEQQTSIWLPFTINILLTIVVPIVLFFMKIRLDASIKASFERQNDALRSELHNNEERLKSELRAKEVELSATLEKVLSGVGSRQALIDERRLKAIEAIWQSVRVARQFKGLASTLGLRNLTAMSKSAATNPWMREFAAAFIKDNPLEQLNKYDGFQERPFISDLAWAYFSAYYIIIIISVTYMKLVSMGVDGLQKFVELEPASRILKSALPHRSEYIETNGLQGFHHLLDELEEKIFSELQKMLAGQEADESDIRRATDVRAKLEEYRNLKDKQQLPPALTQWVFEEAWFLADLAMGFLDSATPTPLPNTPPSSFSS